MRNIHLHLLYLILLHGGSSWEMRQPGNWKCHWKFQDPTSTVAWKIFQHPTTAHKINKCLAMAKCYTSGIKQYITAVPSEGRSAKGEPRSQSCSRSPSSDSDNRQSCPVKATSCRNRCPTPPLLV